MSALTCACACVTFDPPPWITAAVVGIVMGLLAAILWALWVYRP